MCPQQVPSAQEKKKKSYYDGWAPGFKLKNAETWPKITGAKGDSFPLEQALWHQEPIKEKVIYANTAVE